MRARAQPAKAKCTLFVRIYIYFYTEFSFVLYRAHWDRMAIWHAIVVVVDAVVVLPLSVLRFYNNNARWHTTCTACAIYFQLICHADTQRHIAVRNVDTHCVLHCSIVYLQSVALVAASRISRAWQLEAIIGSTTERKQRNRRKKKYIWENEIEQRPHLTPTTPLQ